MERSLRQGDLLSMIKFAFGLDPYLEILRKNLKGILIYSQQVKVQGPVEESGHPLADKVEEERLTAFGYADDVKTAITSIEELLYVDRETVLFEKASGCRLHRNRDTMKVKLLPLGGWSGKLRQQDLPEQCQNIAVTDQLDMLTSEKRPKSVEMSCKRK